MNLTQFTKDKVDEAGLAFGKLPEAEINRMVAEADGCVWHTAFGCYCDDKRHDPANPAMVFKPYATSVDAVLEVVESVGIKDWQLTCEYDSYYCRLWDEITTDDFRTPYFDKEALALAFAVCWYKRLEVK